MKELEKNGFFGKLPTYVQQSFLKNWLTTKELLSLSDALLNDSNNTNAVRRYIKEYWISPGFLEKFLQVLENQSAFLKSKNYCELHSSLQCQQLHTLMIREKKRLFFQRLPEEIKELLDINLTSWYLNNNALDSALKQLNLIMRLSGSPELLALLQNKMISTVKPAAYLFDFSALWRRKQSTQTPEIKRAKLIKEIYETFPVARLEKGSASVYTKTVEQAKQSQDVVEDYITCELEKLKAHEPELDAEQRDIV